MNKFTCREMGFSLDKNILTSIPRIMGEKAKSLILMRELLMPLDNFQLLHSVYLFGLRPGSPLREEFVIKQPADRPADQ